VLAFATASAVIEIEPLPDPFGGRVSELAGGNIEPSTPDPTLPLWPALPLLAAFCPWLLPKVTDMFFVRVGRSRMQRFVFALAGMAAGATVALMGGIEGLIGAFLAGLGMNQPIPNRGPLMLGLLFTAFVIVGKSVAAISTGIMFKFSFDEIALMLSLSFGQAASTLAIAQVRLSPGMFSQIVVNASVIASVLTALLTSYGTRYFAGRVPRPQYRPPAARRGGDPRCALPRLRTRRPRHTAAAIARDDDGLVAPYMVTAPGERASAQLLIDHAISSCRREDSTPRESSGSTIRSRNLLVVGGPRRLSTSRGVTRQTFAATSSRPTIEPA
jgi:hypothetical protein